MKEMIEAMAKWLWEHDFPGYNSVGTKWKDASAGSKSNYRVEVRSLLQTIGINPDLLTKNTRLAVVEVNPKLPEIVCLCGSTRFSEAFQKAQFDETMAGKIVLTIGCNMKSDTEIFGYLHDKELVKIKTMLDELHLRKIDLANEVLILNVGGYIGESTTRELKYAQDKGKRIRFLEEATDATE